MPVLFFIHSWESVVAEGQLDGLIYILNHFIHGTWTFKDFGICGGGCRWWWWCRWCQCPGTNPPWIPRDNLNFGGAKSYSQIFDCIWGLVPLTVCCVRVNCMCFFSVSQELLPDYYFKILRAFIAFELAWNAQHDQGLPRDI